MKSRPLATLAAALALCTLTAWWWRAHPRDEQSVENDSDVGRLIAAAGSADRAGNRALAQRLSERALTLEPKNPAALFQGGVFALRQRDLEKARRNFEACVAVEPAHAEAWMQLVNVQVARGDSVAAARALSAGLAHCPTSPVLHLDRAQRLAAAGSDEEALVEFEHTLRLRPNEAEAFVGGAAVCFRLGRVAEGVAGLRRALVVEPEHPGALTAFASHAIKTGDESGAREWLRRMRDQVRVPVETVGSLAEEFHVRFGRSP